MVTSALFAKVYSIIIVSLSYAIVNSGGREDQYEYGNPSKTKGSDPSVEFSTLFFLTGSL